ncbi:MAG: galactonate dehydratase [Bacteroidetes bacterium]|nr:galactonate dehydratase [Bacteroidota bacterium]MBS1929982.1 galactonate dehydratase [Bacteroidota bacterium]
MKIEKIELFKVPPRWLFLKITTDTGIIGWGEPVVEGKADSILAIVNEMEPYLLGRNANQVEDIFQVLSKGGFYRGGILLMSAISGIEQALWDIKGKALGVPVYEMLGGSVRDKMRIYAWIGGDTAEHLSQQARERIDAGFTAIKLNIAGQLEIQPTPKKINEIKKNIGIVRQVIGEEHDLAIDFHGRVHKNISKRLMKELEEFSPMFYEEPLLPEHSKFFSELRNSTMVPIAAGERLSGRESFRELIYHGGLDILQPDLSHVGGIMEAKKIAAWAETADMFIAPHCPLGPIAFAAALQFDFCTPNVLIQETSMGIHYHKEQTDLLTYVINKDDFHVENGFIHRNSKPGLGVEIDENIVKEMSVAGHDWKNPVWRNTDGSFSEW